MDEQRRRGGRQTASHWGVYEVSRTDGRPAHVVGSELDPHPSPLIHGLPEISRSALRVDRPYVRRGWLRDRQASAAQRGAEDFVPVDWDTALDLVAEELTRVRAEFGDESVYGGCYGWASAGRLHHAPSVLKRFLALNGGYTDKAGNHSFGAALAVLPHVLGRADVPELTPTWPEVVDGADLVVMFGGAHPKNSQVDPGGAVDHSGADWFRRAADAGIRFVTVSPSRDDMPAALGAEWVPIRPNTDVALMLGVAHTLVELDRVDRDFVATHCDGYDEFERYLLGRSDGVAKDAAWASGITGVPAGVVVDLARRMATNRTLVTTSWSVQRADHGEQPVWTTVALAAMLGRIGLSGQGFGLGFGCIRGNVLPRQVEIPRPTLSLGRNPVATRVPVGVFTDLLLRPGETLDWAGRTITLPDTRLVYSAGGNPFHHNNNLNRLLQGWRRLETVIVHEQFWNPAARFADIVLPATTTLERNDVLATEYTRYWIAMHRVEPPHALARNDFDVFAELADRLGFGPAYHQERTEIDWLRHIYDDASVRAREIGYDPVGFDEFWEAGRCEFPERLQAPMLSEFRAAPREHPLDTPSGRIQIASPTIAAFGYDDCPAPVVARARRVARLRPGAAGCPAPAVEPARRPAAQPARPVRGQPGHEDRRAGAAGDLGRRRPPPWDRRRGRGARPQRAGRVLRRRPGRRPPRRRRRPDLHRRLVRPAGQRDARHPGQARQPERAHPRHRVVPPGPRPGGPDRARRGAPGPGRTPGHRVRRPPDERLTRTARPRHPPGDSGSRPSRSHPPLGRQLRSHHRSAQQRLLRSRGDAGRRGGGPAATRRGSTPVGRELRSHHHSAQKQLPRSPGGSGGGPGRRGGQLLAGVGGAGQGCAGSAASGSGRPWRAAARRAASMPAPTPTRRTAFSDRCRRPVTWSRAPSTSASTSESDSPANAAPAASGRG